MVQNPDLPSPSGYATHEVTNQPGPLPGFNAYSGDPALTEAVATFGGDWAQDRLAALGGSVGSTEMRELARQANRYPPELSTHDAYGNRRDEVEFHPSWHSLMRIGRGAGVHSLAWSGKARAQTGRAALSYLMNQGENGICCPLTMTFASVGALSAATEVFAPYRDGILSTAHDPRPIPAERKTALTVGMALTEKQGGSDLRQITTVARKGGEGWLITGHKWFFSVPQSDLFLTLARTEAGISCFLARGWLPDGCRNRLLIQRLKEKCGNRSNASSEVEFRDLEAVMIGEDGRGIATILRMAHLTRLDCAISAGALMRHALTLALHSTGRRQAFQRRLIDQPLMQNVLADLALDAEAFMWSGLRIAGTLEADAGEDEAHLSRVAIPMAKYLACKRVPAFVAEAMECHGGSGYVEDHPIARLYREAPLNGIWEGSGNVICLDVLRALAKPETLAIWRAEIEQAKGQHTAFDDALFEIDGSLRDVATQEFRARALVERMARLFQASLLLRHAPNHIASAFCAARLTERQGLEYGTLSDPAVTASIIQRATVAGTI